jgi:hypothetical protein
MIHLQESHLANLLDHLRELGAAPGISDSLYVVVAEYLPMSPPTTIESSNRTACAANWCRLRVL